MLGQRRVPLERGHAALDEHPLGAVVGLEAPRQVQFGEVVEVEAVVAVALKHGIEVGPEGVVGEFLVEVTQVPPPA